jgi:hypothetical protein
MGHWVWQQVAGLAAVQQIAKHGVFTFLAVGAWRVV